LTHSAATDLQDRLVLTIPLLALLPPAHFIFIFQERTQWHDVLGSHCPKFGVSRTVTLPIPEPVSIHTTDDYKIQFSFDGDRVITSWLQLIGNRAPEAPVLIVELVRSGDALVSSTARVEALPRTDLHYQKVKKEFSDPHLWPKHILVHYKWTARHEVDTERGLVVLFAFGGVAMLLAALSVARTYNKQLRQFVEEVTGESSRFGGGFEKAD
jgi:hypothetical protein